MSGVDVDDDGGGGDGSGLGTGVTHMSVVTGVGVDGTSGFGVSVICSDVLTLP